MTATLLGREPDTAAVREFVDGAVTTGGALLVTGGAGVGKSALLEVADCYGGAAGARIVRVAGSSSLGTAEYAALDQLLGSLEEHFPRLPGPVREALLITRGVAAGQLPSRLRVSAAVLALLRLAGAARPLLVLVENSHKLDRPTALVLAFVARRLAGSRVGLLVEARTGADTQEVLERGGLARHRVGPLDDATAVRLLRSRYPRTVPRVRDRLIAEAAGNPLILLELAGALGERQRAGQEPLPPFLPLGERLEASLRAIAAVFPAATREVLLLAALSEPGDLALLQSAAPRGDVLEALAPAERAGVVSVNRAGRRVAFTLPVLRLAVVQFATNLERRRAQQALAAVLTADPIEQAWHLADAATGPDEQLAARMREVAEAAIRRGEAGAASTALIRSAELSPDAQARTRRMLEAAFIHADVTGNLSDAARLLDRARAAGAEFADSLPVEVVVSYVVVNGELPTDVARRLLVAALDAYPGPGEPGDEVLADALHLLMLNCWTTATPQAWEAFERVFARFRPVLPPRLEMVARGFGDATRLTPEMLGTIRAAAERLRDEDNAVVITRTALACVYTDQLATCREPLRRVIRAGREAGAAAQALQATVSMCCYLWHSGQWAEMTALADDGTARTEQHGYPRYQVLLSGYYPALAAAATGDTARAEELVAEMLEWAARRQAGNAVQFAHHVRAVVAIGGGDYDRAFHEATAISPAGSLVPYTPNALWVLLELVEGAVRSDRLDAARAHVEAMRTAGVARISSRLALVTAGCEALVAADSMAYERALAVADADRWPFDLARVQLAYGEHLRRRHETVGSRQHLIAAWEIFQRLDARPWVARVEQQLRASGHTTGTGAGSSTLSAQERRIAELAAAGLSNKQIGELLHLSHRTVGAHLYRIFPKLGITARAGLRDALRD